MSDARWEQIKSIFNQAMELPASRRQEFVEHACGADAELLNEVRSLLESARPTKDPGAMRTGGVAEVITDMSTASFERVVLKERPGTSVGPYKLLQPIGEGGFGMVFLAEQVAPVRRRVALKVIKLGMDTKAVIARFEAERQALALMDHPHIARVLDGGATETGRPYFVMEYVVGDPITRFADERKLTVPARLGLFAQVCSAVQHAHTKGVIHRDIKPANVLVSMVDGKPFAKVIDFGIAKATASPLTDKTLFTEHKQLIGTPEYMSPEQAEGSHDIDTRTDVYALGVLLYELLTGATPFDGQRLRSAAWGEMQRIIREEEPPAPSVRLNRDQAKLISTAAARAEEPARLGTLLKGELDWIVMKALDKDRGRRYESPNQLAADVQRHLAGEAVVAAPVSKAYRFRKFVRRNKGAAVLGAAVLVGLAGTTFGLVIADRNARVATQNANIALAARDDAEWSAYTANLALAQSAMDAGNFPDARKRIAQCPVNNRGWEWKWLDAMSSSIAWEVGSALTPTVAGPIPAVAVGPDQVRVAVPGLPLLSIDGAIAQQSQSPLNSEEDDENNWDGWTVDVAGNRAAKVAWSGRQGHTVLRAFAIKKSGWSELKFDAAFEDETTPVWSPDGGRIASWHGPDRVWHVRDVQSGHIIAKIPGWDGTPATFDASGDLFAIRKGSDFIVHQCSTGAVLWEMSLSDLEIEHAFSFPAEFHPHRNELLMPGRRLGRYDANTGNRIADYPVRATRAWWLDDDRAIVNQDSKLHIYTFSSGVLESFPISDDRLFLFAGRLAVLQTTRGLCIAMTMAQEYGVRYSTAVRCVPVNGRGVAVSTLWDDNDTTRLAKASVVASSPNGPSGMILTTPDGSRRIVGSSDKTIRFYEAQNGKPTLPPTAESPDGVFREVAILRVPDVVTTLQMTGDGTRLVISLADGTARVWDIRDPAERRKDSLVKWNERTPAGQYLDTLWNEVEAASDGIITPRQSTSSLHDVVMGDSALMPLRRLVALELLAERIHEAEHAASLALRAITRDSTPETDPVTVLSAAVASNVAPRVKEQLLKLAANWKPPEAPTTADTQLAQLANERDAARKERDINLADLIIQRQTQPSENPGYKFPSLEELRSAVKTYQDVLGPASPKSIAAQVALADVLESRGIDRVEAGRIFDDVIRIKEGLVQEPDHELLSMWANRAAIAAKCAEFERAEVLYAKIADHIVNVYAAQPNGHMWIRSPLYGNDGNSQIESKAAAESVAAFFRTLKGPELKEVAAHVLFRDAVTQVFFGANWYAWALDSAQRALAIQPRHSGALAVLAELRFRMSKDDLEARARAAMEAVDAKPDSITKGKVLSRAECANAARELLTRAQANMKPHLGQRWGADAHVIEAIEQAVKQIEAPAHDGR